MGNAVNLAARLEGANKQYRTGGILISEYTKNAVGDEFLCRSLDRVRVVGISCPLRLYEIIGFRAQSSATEIDRIGVWENAIELFEKRQFKEAEEIFSSFSFTKNSSDDGVAKYYTDRCRWNILVPPPANWDGVNNLTQK
jgi:adenylate cyclase